MNIQQWRKYLKEEKKDISVPFSSARVNLEKPTKKRKNFPFQGFIDFQGIEIDVENAPGSTRKGTDESGRAWETKFKVPYGEIRNSEAWGSDGDRLDVYVGPNSESPLVVVITQNDFSGDYDEQKIILGCNNEEEALKIYKQHNDMADKIYDDHTSFAIGHLWTWIKNERNSGKKIKEGKEILQEAAKGIFDLQKFKNSKVQIRRGDQDRVIISYISKKEDISQEVGYGYYFVTSRATLSKRKLDKRTAPRGFVIIKSSKSSSDGACLGGWIIDRSFADRGWGPMLYDVAIEWATRDGSGLIPDRFSVSPAASAVWDYYNTKRDDIIKKQLDIENRGYEKLTPRNPKDDCWQISSFIDQERTGKRRENWFESSLSKIYQSKGTLTINALRKIGKLDDQTQGIQENKEVLKEEAKGIKDLAIFDTGEKRANITVLLRSNQIMFKFYSGNGDQLGAVRIRKAKDAGYGPCLKAWMVAGSYVEHDGFGPMLYDVAMEYATKMGSGLVSDRTSVSKDAKAIWDYYMIKRKEDVIIKQMDTLWTPPDKITPRDPSDDCVQVQAVDYSENHWTDSSLSKMFSSKGTPTIDALIADGRWEDQAGLLKEAKDSHSFSLNDKVQFSSDILLWAKSVLGNDAVANLRGVIKKIDGIWYKIRWFNEGEIFQESGANRQWWEKSIISPWRNKEDLQKVKEIKEENDYDVIWGSHVKQSIMD